MLSVNITQFWERWHISLSQWIRDYVFLPLGRALYGTRLRTRPVLLALITFETTFLLVGAWHGMGINFLVWGAYHGLLLGGHHLYARRAPAWLAEWPPAHSWLATLASRALTFGLVTLGWVPFVFDAAAKRANPEAAGRRRTMRKLAEDAILGVALAILIALLVLSSGFDSTFLYRGF